MQGRSASRLLRVLGSSQLGGGSALPFAPQRHQRHGSREENSRSAGAKASGLLLAGFFGFLGKKKRPHEDPQCRDPLNTALSYAWIARRLDGDLAEAEEVMAWVQARLEEADSPDAYASIRYHDASGDCRYQLATQTKASDAQRYADFERALAHYSLAYKGLVSLPAHAASGIEHKAQLRLLQIKSAAVCWALGEAAKAEAILRKALEGQAMVEDKAKPVTGFLLPPVAVADFYRLPESANIFDGRSLLFSAQAMLSFCHERLALFLAGSIAPLNSNRPSLSKEESERLREAREQMRNSLSLLDVSDADAVQHAFVAVRAMAEELLRLQQTTAANQFLNAAAKVLRGLKGEAAPALAQGLRWIRLFSEEINARRDFVRAPKLSFAQT